MARTSISDIKNYFPVNFLAFFAVIGGMIWVLWGLFLPSFPAFFSALLLYYLPKYIVLSTMTYNA